MKYDITLPENIDSTLDSLVKVLRQNKEEIIKTGIITNIALETFPNYKNYKYIISGITQARMMKGVNGKSKIESQVREIFSTYGLEEINNDIIEKSAELMIATFDSVFLKSGNKLKEQYIDALEDIEFLYINLKLAVKIIAETLKTNGVVISNRTLNYITEGIKREKKDIATKYIEAYISRDVVQLQEARENYRSKMEKMLKDYIYELSVPVKDSLILGKEQLIVENIGKENLDYITSFLLLEIKEKVYLDNRIQRMLKF